MNTLRPFGVTLTPKPGQPASQQTTSDFGVGSASMALLVSRMRGMGRGTCREVLPLLHIGSTANEMTGSNVIRRPHSRKKNQRVRTTGNQLPSREITGPRTMGEGAHRNRCATVYSHCETALGRVLIKLRVVTAIPLEERTHARLPPSFASQIAAPTRVILRHRTSGLR